MIYQHATSKADRAIAQAVSDAVKAERKKGQEGRGRLVGQAEGEGQEGGQEACLVARVARRALLARATSKALAGTRVLTRAFVWSG
jgi:hypothetical protein